MSNATLIMLPHACKAAIEIKEGGSTRPADILPILERLIRQDREMQERKRSRDKVTPEEAYPFRRT